LRDQLGEGDLDRVGHVVSPEPLGSKASVLMRRSRQLGCSTLIISTASIEHSSQIRACGPATSCITSLCFLPQNEQAGVLIVAFELSLVGPITAGEGGHARSSRRSGREGSRQKPKTRVLLGFLSFLAEGVSDLPLVFEVRRRPPTIRDTLQIKDFPSPLFATAYFRPSQAVLFLGT
jgi:hypothetical protein